MHACFSFEKQYYAIFRTKDKISSPSTWAMPINEQFCMVWKMTTGKWSFMQSINPCLKVFRHNVIVEVGSKIMLSCSDVIPIWQITKNIKSFFFIGKIKPFFFIIDNLINFLNPSLYKKLGCQFLTLGKKVYYIAIPKIIWFMGFYVTTYF